jgi:dTMP kinase
MSAAVHRVTGRRDASWFLVIEGLDGVGKSTIAAAVAEATGAELLSTPGGDLREVRAVLDERYRDHPLASALFYASTVARVSDCVRRNRTIGRPTIVDRFLLSTLVYGEQQGVGRLIAPLGHLFEVPTLTAFLTAPIGVRRERIRSRGKPTEGDLDTLDPVRDRLLVDLFRRYGQYWCPGRFVEIPTGNRPAWQVAAELVAIVETLRGLPMAKQASEARIAT